MRILCFLFVRFCFAVSCFSISSAYAGESKQRVTLVTGLSPPYVYYAENGELRGIIIDMVKMMNDVSDYDIAIYHVPPPRIYLELADGYADLSILPPGPDTEAVADPIIEVSRASVVLASLNKNKRQIDTLNDLSRKRVGYVKGINYGSLFDNIPDVYEVPLLSTDVGIEMLLRDRIDFILSSERTLAYHLQAKRVSDNVVMAHELHKVAVYLYVSKKSKYKAELQAHFSEIINHLIANDSWQETYKHLSLFE